MHIRLERSGVLIRFKPNFESRLSVLLSNIIFECVIVPLMRRFEEQKRQHSSIHMFFFLLLFYGGGMSIAYTCFQYAQKDYNAKPPGFRRIAYVTAKQQRLVEANGSNRLPEANESLRLVFRRYMKCNEVSG